MITRKTTRFRKVSKASKAIKTVLKSRDYKGRRVYH